MADYAALPLFTDAYMADCSHLSDAEHGRYLLLLMLMWRSPGCRVALDGEALPPTVAEMFSANGDGIEPGFYSRRHVDWSLHPSRLLNSTWRRVRNAFLRAMPRVCAYCGATNASHWEVDHVRSRANGGTHDWSNLAVACRPCNRSKGRNNG